MRPARLSATVLAFAVLSGCGADKRNDVPRVTSKAGFIAAADRICVERDTRSRQLASEPGTNVGRLTARLATLYETSITKLEALELPPGAARAGAAKYVRSVSAMRRPVARMKATATGLQAASSAGEVKRVGTQLGLHVNTVQAISDLADQNARGYGMKSCGQQQSLPAA